MSQTRSPDSVQSCMEPSISASPDYKSVQTPLLRTPCFVSRHLHIRKYYCHQHWRVVSCKAFRKWRNDSSHIIAGVERYQQFQWMQAVKTYTHCLKDIDEGRLPEWKTRVPPQFSRYYWGLKDDSTMRDLIMAVSSSYYLLSMMRSSPDNLIEGYRLISAELAHVIR